jgi:hypothetical protein
LKIPFPKKPTPIEYSKKDSKKDSPFSFTHKKEIGLERKEINE